MKLKYTVIFLLFFSCDKAEFSIGRPPFLEQIDFVETFGGSKNEVANSVVKTVDGGYAIAGFVQSNDKDIKGKNDKSYDYFVLKFSSTNALQWSKTYGGTNDDRANDIIQTFDSGFAVFGYTKSNDGNVSESFGNRDFWLAKLSSDGSLDWKKTFGYIGRDLGTTLIQTDDGGYLICGELDVTASNGQGKLSTSQRHAGGDYWAIKLNSKGDKEWSKYYGGNFSDTPKGIAKTEDGGYIIVGTSDSFDVDISKNRGTYDFWVIRISPKGELIWEKNFGGKEIDEASGIVATKDGNFIIVGDTRSNDQNVSVNNGGADLWVIKINPNGELIWEKSFGGSSFDVARSISKTFDGGYIISGSSRSLDNGFENKGQNDAWVLKISEDGNQEWQKFIGGSQIDFFYDAVELNNGNIIAVGESSSNNGDVNQNKGFSDLLITKIK